MKKMTLLAAVVVAVSFASCKKERTCECNVTNGGVAYNKTYDLGKTKKKDAQTVCDSYKTTYSWESCTVK